MLALKAYAKLNLCLEILGKRPDGYHEVLSVIQAIDLADELEFTEASNLQVRCSGADLDGERNLVWRALHELARESGREPRLAVNIRKRIPLAMGLGGGSSDAASALVAANQLLGLGWQLSELAELGARLGSDVPFFLWGGAALASGRGEKIELLPSQARVGVTLICPDFTLENKTASLYGRIRAGDFSDGSATGRLVAALKDGGLQHDLLRNAFTGPAMEAFPALPAVFNAVEAACGRRPHLTGAGPASFLLPSTAAECETVARALQPYGAGVFCTHPLGAMIRIPVSLSHCTQQFFGLSW